MSVSTPKIEPQRPEFRLLLTCARFMLTEEQGQLVKTRAEQDLNWDYLLKMASWHGLLPMLFRHLSQNGAQVPSAVLDMVSSQLKVLAVSNLALTNTLMEALAQLGRSGIDCVPYKGPILAQMLYGSVGLRVFVDLDIVVRKQQAKEARDCLNRLGFTDAYGLSPAEQGAAFSFRPEHSIVRGDVNIDLHWHLVPRFVSPGLEMDPIWARSRQTRLFGQSIAVFSDDDLLFILALHAAQHEWLQMKWFCDIGELLRTRTALDWDHVLRQLTDSHTERCVLVSFEIVRRHWAAVVPPEIEKRIAHDPHVAALATRVIESFWPLPQYPLRTPEMGMPWFMARTEGQAWNRARLAAAMVFWPTIDDFESFRLSRCYWRYPVLRLARLIAKYSRRCASETL